MPWGFLVAIWRARLRAGFIGALILALLSGASLSAGVELAQVYAPSRTPSLVDISTNTLGSILGAVIGWPWASWVWPRLSPPIRHVIASRRWRDVPSRLRRVWYSRGSLLST